MISDWGRIIMLVTVSGSFRVQDENLDASTDAVMDALLEAEAVAEGRFFDPDIRATLAEGHVEVSIVVDARSLRDAEQYGVTVIEGAIQASGNNVSSTPIVRSEEWQETARSSELVSH